MFLRIAAAAALLAALLAGLPASAAEPLTLDDAFARLAQPEGEGWRIAESDILREWSKSGSPAMDLLLKRGEEALDQGDAVTAIGHLTALVETAPDVTVDEVRAASGA